MANTFYLVGGGAGVAGYDLASPRTGTTNTIAITNTSASGTDIQITKTAGGTPLSFATRPLSAAVTIAGTVTINAWGTESGAGANAGFRMKLYRLQANGTKTLFATLDRGIELGIGVTVQNWTGTPTSTAFAIGDRIVMEPYLTNVGTMAAPFTVDFRYDRGSPASAGDSYVTFTEDVRVTSRVMCQ